jgi:hypothetical protein
MELEDVRGELENGKKRKFCGRQFWKSRKVKVKEKLTAKLEENAGLRILAEQQKVLLEEKQHKLVQEKPKLKELRHQLRNRKS